MEIAFDSKQLRTLCEREDDAQHILGTVVAEVLKHRLADMRAATAISDIVVGHVRPLNDANDDNMLMVLDLCANYRITFCANHPKNPHSKSGTIDWSRVRRIKILQIECYHD